MSGAISLVSIVSSVISKVVCCVNYCMQYDVLQKALKTILYQNDIFFARPAKKCISAHSVYKEVPDKKMKSKAHDEPKDMLRGIIYITLLNCRSFLKTTAEKLFRDFPILLVKPSQHICYLLSLNKLC